MTQGTLARRPGAFDRFGPLFDGSPESIAIARGMTLVYANPACARLFGFGAPTELFGRSALDLVAPDAREMILEFGRRRGMGSDVPALYRTMGIRRDGTKFELEVRNVLLGHDFVLVAHVEIADTDRPLPTAAMGEDFYRAIFDLNLAIKLLIDPSTGQIVDANRAAVEFYGFTLAELRGKRVSELNTLTEDELRAEMHAAVSGRRGYFRFRHRIASGEVRAVEVYSSPIEIGERRLLFSIIHDVTERDGLEQQLRASQRLEAIGSLAGGIAHEFNNLLTVMLNASTVMRRHVDESSALFPLVQDTHFAAQRAAQLTRELLAFSRRQLMQPRTLDLNEVVSELAGVLQRTFGESIVVTTELAPDLPPTRIDPRQLEQVLMNLLLNARDAMRKGGRVAIRTSAFEGIPPVHAARSEGARSFIVLRVIDEGVGMDEATRARIFEPMFTTKAPGDGTGLGMATVYGIVTQSGGYVTVDSELGKGTTIAVYLPVVDDPPSGVLPSEEPRRLSRPAPGCRVLLVEDMGSVRMTISRELAAAGLVVLEAASAEEAQALLEKEIDGLHALVTDIVLPGASGIDLAERALARRPGLPIVVISGDLRGHDVGRLPRAVRTLQKPFTSELLLHEIAAALDETC